MVNSLNRVSLDRFSFVQPMASMLSNMVEVKLLTCPHCQCDAFAGSHRLRCDGRLGCIHCGEPFDMGSATVKTLTLHSEKEERAWGGQTRERRQQGRSLLPRD